MNKTLSAVISTVSVLFVIVALCGSAVWILRREGLDVYVEYNGKKYLATDKLGSVGRLTDGIHTFIVGNLSGGQTKYEIKITPNPDNAFEYITDGSVKKWGKDMTDYKQYFGYEQTHNGFVLNIPAELTVQSILESECGETEIIGEPDPTANYFLLTVKSGNTTMSITLGVPLIPPQPADGVTVTPEQITF